MIRLLVSNVLDRMSRIIIVKLERRGESEVTMRSFDSRYKQHTKVNTEIARMLRGHDHVFAEARLQADGTMILLRRARERGW